MNDLEIQLALAKALPELIYYRNNIFYWHSLQVFDDPVSHREWLEVMNEAEKNLDGNEQYSYIAILSQNDNWLPWRLLTSTWNAKGLAYLEVKKLI